MALALSRPILARAIRCACSAPSVAEARAVVRAGLAVSAPLVCADSAREGGAASPRKDRAKAAQYYKLREPVIEEFYKVVQRHFKIALAETLKNIEHRRLDVHSVHSVHPVHAAAGYPGGIAADLIFDLEDWEDGLLAAVRSESRKALDTSASQCWQELQEAGRVPEDDVFSMPEPKALEFMDTRENLMADVPKNFHREIMDQLQEGIENGETMAELAERIHSAEDGICASRSMTIASTEVGAAYGFARHETMTAAGITKKRWLTSHLPNVRQAHEMAEDDERNQGIPLDQPFEVGGEKLMYPGDPAGSPGNVINCHCVEIGMEAGEEV